MRNNAIQLEQTSINKNGRCFMKSKQSFNKLHSCLEQEFRFFHFHVFFFSRFFPLRFCIFIEINWSEWVFARNSVIMCGYVVINGNNGIDYTTISRVLGPWNWKGTPTFYRHSWFNRSDEVYRLFWSDCSENSCNSQRI